MKSISLKPDYIIVDSIQTVFSEKLESAPGSVSQVREVAGQFMMFAKQTATPVFLSVTLQKKARLPDRKHSNILLIRFYILKATAITITESSEPPKTVSARQTRSAFLK